MVQKNKLSQAGRDETQLHAVFFLFYYEWFPNDLCVFLTDVDIIIKQISHWLKFTINNLGFVWGDALCKTRASGQNTSGSRE